MLASCSSMQFESETASLGNPSRFNQTKKCSRNAARNPATAEKQLKVGDGAERERMPRVDLLGIGPGMILDALELGAEVPKARVERTRHLGVFPAASRARDKGL